MSKTEKELNDPSKMYSCPYCGLLIRLKWNLTVHIRKHESFFPYECTECERKFTSATAFRRHKQSHGEPQYPCDKCPNQYRTSRGLQYHQRSQHGDLTPCKICGQTFNSFSEYRLHRMSHKDKSNLLECSFCYKSFSSEKFRQKHLEEMHSSQQRKKIVYNEQPKKGPLELVYENKCTICGYFISSKYEFKNHLFSQHVIVQESQYMCAHCSYVMPLVGKKGIRNNRMRNHLSRHSKVKPFKCKQCNYRAVRSSDLFSHVASLHEKLKFDCNFCDKKFSNVKSLTQHAKIHGDPDNKYKCDRCEKSYWSIHKLRVHRDSHDQDCEYLCHFCNKIFTKYYSLTQHKARVHLMKNESINTALRERKSLVTSESQFSPNYGKSFLLYECFACGHISNTLEGASCCESFQKKVSFMLA